MNRFFRVLAMAAFVACVCLAETNFAQTAPQNVRKTVVKSDDHLAYVDRIDGKIVITIEAVSDFTNEIYGVPPNKDFAWLTIDMNKNKKVDSMVDRVFGVDTKEPKICAQFLYDGQASSMCGAQRSDGTLEIKFEGTAAQVRPHPVFKFTFPENELNTDGKGINLVLRIHSAGIGNTYYPEKGPGDPFYSVSKTIAVKF